MSNVDSLMSWLTRWLSTKWQVDMTISVSINTLDNPGWGVSVELGKIDPSTKKLPLCDNNFSEENWYYCTVRGSRFEGDGGPFNLVDILSVFKQYIKNNDTENGHLSLGSNDFDWLMRWYYGYCNGDWEHGFGIRIITLDNLGWNVSIDLGDTDLENRSFEKISYARSETDWLRCVTKEKRFETECGLTNMPAALKIFREWAEAT